jgi:hypothetical protein
MKKKLSWRWFEIGLLVLSMGVHLYIALCPANSLMNWYINDDAFYYFKVAQNIVTGHGVTFDGINVTNGFHPLWMLVCIPVFWFARFSLILPLRFLIVLAGLLSAGTGVLLFRLLWRIVSPFSAACAAVLWVTSWTVNSSIVRNGLESNLAAFFITLLLLLVVSKKERKPSFWWRIFIGAVAGLTVLSRLDTVYLVMLLGAWFVLDSFTPYLRVVLVGDLGIICSAGLLSFFIRLGTGPLYIANSAALPILVALNFVLTPLFLLLFRLYKPFGEKLSFKYILRVLMALLLATVLSGGILIVLQKLSVFAALPRLVIPINAALLLVGVLLSRLVARWAFVEKENRLTTEPTLPGIVKTNWKQMAQRGLAYFVPVLVLLGAYMIWSLLAIGTPMPVSGQVKHWWGGLLTVYGKPVQGGAMLFGFENRGAWSFFVSAFENVQAFLKLGDGVAYGLAALAGTAVAVGMVFLVLKKRAWVLDLVERLALPAWFWGMFTHTFYYTTTSYVHLRPWYWSAEMLFSIAFLAVLFDRVWPLGILPRKRQWIGVALLVVIGLISTVSYTRTVLLLFPYTDRAEEHEYITDARNLESMTEAGALIGMTGSGANGYFIQDRTIVNLDGLINSLEYFRLLQTGQGDVLLDRIGLDYVYGSSIMLTDSDPYWELLDGHLEVINVQGNTTLYRYHPTP